MLRVVGFNDAGEVHYQNCYLTSMTPISRSVDYEGWTMFLYLDRTELLADILASGHPVGQIRVSVDQQFEKIGPVIRV